MSKTHQIKSFFKFLKQSTNQHGVHSPFVYDLVTKCFYDNKKKPAYQDLKKYRASLLKNKNSIPVNDLGFGSQIFKTNNRVVSKMAKIAGSSFKEANFLYRLSHYFKFNAILELGTSLGIATHALATGNPTSKVTTIEGCTNISALAKTNFKHFNLSNTEVLTGDFKNIIPPLSANKYDLIYFDGNHNKEATLSYFETLLPTISNDSLFVFDDIYWSKGMTEAWEIIKQHHKVKVTIDTYKFGLVFFRKEQVKEHFIIRL